MIWLYDNGDSNFVNRTWILQLAHKIDSLGNRIHIKLLSNQSRQTHQKKFFNLTFLIPITQLKKKKNTLTTGFDWKSFYDSNQFPTTNISNQWTYQTHGVNNAQALKSSALRYRYTNDTADIFSTIKRIDLLDTYHGQPSGMFSCSETLAGLHPSQGKMRS